MLKHGPLAIFAIAALFGLAGCETEGPELEMEAPAIAEPPVGEEAVDVGGEVVEDEAGLDLEDERPPAEPVPADTGAAGPAAPLDGPRR